MSILNKKQDRQGVRTPADIERKYDLGQDVSEVIQIATEAKSSADRANSALSEVKQISQDAETTAKEAKDAVEKNAKDITDLNKDVSDLNERFEEFETTGGVSGATFTPSVDEDGNLSWTNNRGLENPETVNIKGEQGESGASAVYIGTEPPTNEACVWLNPNASVQFNGFEIMSITEIKEICGG